MRKGESCNRLRHAVLLVLAYVVVLLTVIAHAAEAQAGTKPPIHLQLGPSYIHAWLYLPSKPAANSTLPLVLSAPALGFPAVSSLKAQSETLAASGLAVLAFDYPSSCFRGLAAISCQRRAWQQVFESTEHLAKQYGLSTAHTGIIGVEWSAGIALDAVAQQPRRTALVVVQVSQASADG
jgi:hypothetical protein